MEENSDCKHCSTWEEEMYWKHFNSIHFFQTLNSDFHDHLVLPEKFTAHMKDHLPDKVSLKGPSGALWDIELLKSDDVLFVGNGWKDFVKVNELNENYALVFKFERNSSFEVLIFDQGSSCEKESAYFVKNCEHAKPKHEDNKKRTSREASSTEVIEVDGEEDFAFVVSKKSRQYDDEMVVCSGRLVNTQGPGKHMLYTAARPKVRPRRVVLPRKQPSEPKIQSGKSIRKEADKKLSENLQSDMVTLESGEISPKKNHCHKLESQSKRSLNGEDTANGPTQVSRELIFPENEEHSPATDHCQQLKDHSEKPLSGNVSSSETCHVSRYTITIKNGETRVIDQSHTLKDLSVRRHREKDTFNERSQILRKELITPENGQSSPVIDCSHKCKGQGDLVEKELSESSSGNMIQYSRRKVFTPDYGESSPMEGYSCESHGKRGLPKKQMLPKSSKKQVFKSDKKRFSKEYISNRRPVTEMEKEDALRRAKQKQTENSFTAVMRPTSVYKRFFLSFPAEWLHKSLLHMNEKQKEVVLRVEEKTWHATLVNYGCKFRGISTGWKKFAIENFLEEFDVLVFKLVSQEDKAAAVMDVDIFRVIPTIIPPLPHSS